MVLVAGFPEIAVVFVEVFLCDFVIQSGGFHIFQLGRRDVHQGIFGVNITVKPQFMKRPGILAVIKINFDFHFALAPALCAGRCYHENEQTDC